MPVFVRACPCLSVWILLAVLSPHTSFSNKSSANIFACAIILKKAVDFSVLVMPLCSTPPKRQVHQEMLPIKRPGRGVTIYNPRCKPGDKHEQATPAPEGCYVHGTCLSAGRTVTAHNRDSNTPCGAVWNCHKINHELVAYPA